jgi:hypothetical protein
MSDNIPAKKPQHETPSDKAPKTPPPVAVKCLTFFQAHPNFNARTSISAETAANKGRVTIEFHAFGQYARHHRVEFSSPGTPPRVSYIWEGHVASFEPLT